MESEQKGQAFFTGLCGGDQVVRHLEFRYDDLYGLQNVACFGPAQRGAETQLNDVHRTFTLLGQIESERQDHGLGRWIATDHRLRWEDKVSQFRLAPIVEFAYDNDQPTTAAGVARRSTPGWNHVRRKFIQYPGKRRIYYKYEDTRGAPNVGLNRVRELREWLTLHYGVRNKPHQPRLAGYSYLGVDQIQGVERPHPDTDTSISWQLDQGGYLLPAGPRLSTLDAFDRPKQFTSHLESRGDFVNTKVRELEEIVYDYDRHSNVTGRGSENYVYDDLQRMTHAMSGGEVRGHWQLDHADNWNAYFENYTALKGSNTAAYRQKREHDQANRTGDMSINGTVPLLQPAYDAVGNMTRLPKLPDGKKVLYCQYDFWNRLVRVHEGERNSQTGRFETRKLVEYDYDGLGRRIVRRAYDGEKAPQETRHYYYNDNWQVLNEWVEVPQQDRTVKLRLDREYVWGIRGPNDLILCDTEHNRLGLPQGMLYPLQDLNWNTTRLYRPVEGDSKFELVEQYAYDPYGGVSMFDKDGNAVAGSSVRWDMLFGGYHYDELTGLYLARNRVYAPGLGRWLQEDPSGFTDSYNQYQYGVSNPVTYYDPNGELVLLAGALIVGALAIAGTATYVTILAENSEDPAEVYSAAGRGLRAGGANLADHLTFQQVDALHDYRTSEFDALGVSGTWAEYGSDFGAIAAREAIIALATMGLGNYVSSGVQGSIWTYRAARTAHAATTAYHWGSTGYNLYAGANQVRQGNPWGLLQIGVSAIPLTGAIRSGATRSALHWAKMKANYRLRHIFGKKLTLKDEKVLYSFKNPAHFNAGTSYDPLDLWMTPTLMSPSTAVQRLSLKYPSGYDTILKVVMPKGSRILKPRRVWKLFGREGGGIETRNITPITPSMYQVFPPL